MVCFYKFKIYSYYKLFITRFYKIYFKYFIYLKKIQIIALPVKHKKYTVLRSPHINKKSKEQFESKMYSHFFIFNNYNKKNLLNFIKFLKYFSLSKTKILPLKIKIQQQFLI